MITQERRLTSLFQAGIGGDSEAYREFLEEAAILLRGFIGRRLYRAGHQNSVEDVLQETLLAIHTRAHTHDPEVPLTAWLYGIAKFKITDHFRASSQSSRNAVAWDDSREVVGDDGHRAELGAIFNKLLAALPTSYRIPIQMMKVEGRTSSEVSKATGLSEAAIRVNVHRGLKQLRQMFRGISQVRAGHV